MFLPTPVYNKEVKCLLSEKIPNMTFLSTSLLGRIVAMLIRATHSPSAAFQKYLDENPWSPEAKMYDI